MNCVVVNITSADKKEAEKIAKALLAKKFVACVNIISGVHSVYWWKGKLETSDEVLLIAKTRQDLVKKVIAEVKELHSYEVPEIIAMPIIEGNPDYIRWIKESTISANG